LEHIGELVPNNPEFYTKACLFPLGYQVKRKYWSATSFGRANYLCEIVSSTIDLDSIHEDNSESGIANEERKLTKPLFKITQKDDPSVQVISDSAYGKPSSVFLFLKTL
jgi:hypothetical protein